MVDAGRTGIPAAKDEDATGSSAILLTVIAMHLFALCAFWGLLGFRNALMLVLVAGTISALVWQREKVQEHLRRARNSPAVQKARERAAARFASFIESSNKFASRSVESQLAFGTAHATARDGSDTDVIEIQPATDLPFTVEWIPKRASRRVESGTTRLLGLGFPPKNIAFFGPGSTIALDRGVLHNPFVYATEAAQSGRFDASLIDATLPVSATGTVPTERLPYWPSYFEADPEQRSKYLDWLVDGKSESRVELGYVFMFFYGLERRIIVDRKDLLSVVPELLRLTGIYGWSHSFAGYSASLIWLTIFLAGQEQSVPSELVSSAIQKTTRWTEDLLSLCLAYFHAQRIPIPPELALLVAKEDPRATSSVIVRRHPEVFNELFTKRYCAQFPSGMVLKCDERPRRYEYRPASGTLLRVNSSNLLRMPVIPDILAITSQFKPLVTLWENCIEELKTFNRVTKSSVPASSSEAYEALPEELRDADHPEMSKWLQIWQQFTNEQGYPIVPISALAGIKSYSNRGKLTKAQCSKLLATADAIGMGVEPDARLTCKNYNWEDRVCLFFLDDEIKEDMTAYSAASLLLRLGTEIAAADGHVQEHELRTITQHLASRFELTAADSKRLDRLRYLLHESDHGDTFVASSLVRKLPRTERLVVGEFLVGVAAADQVINDAELRALRKAYRLLDLQEGDLDRLIDAYAIPVGKNTASSRTTTQPVEFRLDTQAIARIMAETQQVAQILTEAIAAESLGDGNGVDASATSEATTRGHDLPVPTKAALSGSEYETVPSRPHFDGLDIRFVDFLQSLLAKPNWSGQEIKALARDSKIMLSGAIEVINEWSTDRFGDWLIEEGEPYSIRTDLIKDAL